MSKAALHHPQPEDMEPFNLNNRIDEILALSEHNNGQINHKLRQLLHDVHEASKPKKASTFVNDNPEYTEAYNTALAGWDENFNKLMENE